MINMKRGHVDIIDKEGEVWKDVIGYEGYYKISNFGRIMTVRRIENITKFGKATTMIINQRLGAITINKQGYPCAILTINGNTKRCLIHRVLAQAFIPNPENKKTVNHKNGIKCDNNLDNLEWATYTENIKHAYDNGLRKVSELQKTKYKMLYTGEGSHRSKLKENDISVILSMRKDGISVKDIAFKYNVNTVTIYNVINGKRWNNIQIIKTN